MQTVLFHHFSCLAAIDLELDSEFQMANDTIASIFSVNMLGNVFSML